MSNVFRRVLLWLDRLFTPAAEPARPDAMSLEEWADLPPHHPLCP
jgi:hypothetical protein